MQDSKPADYLTYDNDVMYSHGSDSVSEVIIFPSSLELKEILSSKTAQISKDKNAFFECTHLVRNMRLRLVIMQCTIDGVEVADVMVTPSENKTTDVFPFLQRSN
jgi:hypothetical protein